MIARIIAATLLLLTEINAFISTNSLSFSRLPPLSMAVSEGNGGGVVITGAAGNNSSFLSLYYVIILIFYDMHSNSA